MKIGILTQPLGYNYGGLLQAWALQKTLAEMGHDVTIINRVYDPSLSPIPLWRRSLSYIKNELYIALGKRKRNLPITDELKAYIEQYTRKFLMNRFKGITPEIKTNEQFLGHMAGADFDAYVVGSDQVWRPRYSPNLMTYFLDFAKDDKSVKKIAYAASFGVSTWELNKRQTNEARKLAKLFDIITVREASAVRLVKKHLGCEAFHVLDPTLLVDRKDYMELSGTPTCPLHKSEGELFCYVLDKSDAVSDAIDGCRSNTGFKPFFCNYNIPWARLHDYNLKDECVLPPVEQWIRSFDDAKMVITDSFHGTVFSIIFNKPFWVLPNKNRGRERFRSLLRQFNLEDRIVSDSHKADWFKSIDWEAVNTKRTELIESSISLLASGLR